ncbi:hypothetical protein QTP86_004399 [Hemibagrus guttatus]|nr:hypothetical protein QTP86_004399 [Hemibagrus guttatus]
MWRPSVPALFMSQEYIEQQAGMCEQFTLCSALLEATQQVESQAAELKEKQHILYSVQGCYIQKGTETQVRLRWKDRDLGLFLRRLVSELVMELYPWMNRQ